MERRDHWEKIYNGKETADLGWYRAHLETSYRWITELVLPASAIIDVGAGVSTLVDELMGAGYKDLTMLDLSATALEIDRARLGEKADQISWIRGDITQLTLPENRFVMWHDRAVFHFLTDSAGRSNYLKTMSRAIKPAGFALIATFSPEAPGRCSGLSVQCYSAEQLNRELGPSFTLSKERRELHTTPGGVEQMYNYCLFQKKET